MKGKGRTQNKGSVARRKLATFWQAIEKKKARELTHDRKNIPGGGTESSSYKVRIIMWFRRGQFEPN